MSFAEHIKSVVDGVAGAEAGMVIGFDGLPVETYSIEGSELDLESVGAEISARVRDMFALSEELGLGQVEEFVLRCSKATILVRLLNDEYCLLIALRSTRDFGRGRFLMRTIVPRVLAEFD